jgi:diguanylate cyclase (GGDEF)-like protein
MILVAGSVHMDVLSRISGEKGVLDKTGNVAVSIGGTAGNLAVNLQALGLDVRLLSAMNSSPYSDIILTHLKNCGIETFIDRDDSLPLAAFVAHLDEHGDLVSAVSSMPVEQHVFEPEVLASAMNGVDAVVAECNLSSRNILTLVGVARELGVPVYLAGVSEIKIERVADILGSYPVHALFCNRIEANRFLSCAGIETDLEAAKTLGGAFIVTSGKDGASLSTAAGTTTFPATPIEASGIVLGAGDTLMSVTIYNHLKGLPLPYAIQKGIEAASESLSRENCNLSEPKAMEDILSSVKNESMFDGLTGLLNRAALSHAAESMISLAKRGSRPLSVVMFDIDDFKSVNDTFGHGTGDEVIRAVAVVAKESMRGSDIVGRWGGEEFICVMMDATETSALEIAERIRAKIQQSIVDPWKITVSGGVATLGWNEAFSTLVARADNRLYYSKETGKNRITAAFPQENIKQT